MNITENDFNKFVNLTENQQEPSDYVKDLFDQYSIKNKLKYLGGLYENKSNFRGSVRTN